MELHHDYKKKTDELERLIFSELPEQVLDSVAEKLRLSGDVDKYYSYLTKIARANGIAPIDDETKELENTIIGTAPNLVIEICEDKWNLYNEVTIDEFVGEYLKYLKKLAKREGIPFKEY